MPAHRHVRCVWAVALVVVVTACGSSSSGSASSTTAAEEPTSLATWQEETTALCDEFEPQQAAIVAEHPSSDTYDQVVALIDALQPLVDRYVEALGDVPVPASQATDVERTYELNRLNGDSVLAMRAAAVAGDRPGVDAAGEALRTQSDELRALLTDLGVPACV